MGRAGFRLPCLWSRMSVRAADGIVTYTSRRRPGPRGAYSRVAVRPGARVGEPTGLEHLLTARRGMRNAFFGGAAYPPNRTTVRAGRRTAPS